MIWKLVTDANKDLVLRTDIDYFENHFIAQPMASTWSPPAIRIEGRSKRLRDIASWMRSAPVISERARAVLEGLISEHCEVLPLIELRGQTYYAINILTVLRGCVDVASSDIRLAPDGSVNGVFSVSFLEGDIPSRVPIFKVPEDAYGDVYVTRLFVDAIVAAGLRGMAFADPAANEFERILQGRSLNVVPEVDEPPKAKRAIRRGAPK